MIIFAAIFFGISFIPRVLNKYDDPTTESSYFADDETFAVYVADPEINQEMLSSFPLFSEADFYDDEDAMLEAYEAEELDQALVLDRQDGVFTGDLYLHDVGMNDSLYLNVEKSLRSFGETMYLMEHGVNPLDYAQTTQQMVDLEVKSDGRDAMTGFVFAYFGIFLLYFTILFLGSTVATNVASEKNNRTMELLITQVSSKALVHGKVRAMTLLAIFEIAVQLLALLLGYLVNRASYPDYILKIIHAGVTVDIVLLFLLFGITGAIFFFFLFATVGSLVDRVEDVSAAMAPVMALFLIAFMGTMFSMSNPSSVVLEVFSYLPFTSPFALITRHLMVTMQAWEIALSYGILLLSTLFTAHFAVRIYREGTLSYGGRLSIVQALKRSYQD